MGGPPVMQPKAGAGREGVVVIKLLVVRVDATHQRTALDIFQ